MLGGQRYKTFRVLNCVVTTTMRMKPCANIQVEYNGKFMKTRRKAAAVMTLL